MRGRSILFVVLLVALSTGMLPAIFQNTHDVRAQDLRCLPVSLLCPINMLVIEPDPGDTTTGLQPDIMVEVVSNTQELLTSELRMIISACDAPNSSGFRISDSGIEYVTNSNEYFPHMAAYLDEIGCTLPSDSEIEVTVMAKSRDFTGAIYERGITWTFYTPDVPSGPSPEPPPSTTSPTPLPQISSISAISGVSPGARIQVNGTGFVSTGSYQSYILFDSSMTDYTGNLGASTLEFYIPNEAECGDHTVQVANPRSGGQIPRYSNVYVLEMECEDESPPPSNGTSRLAIRSFSPEAAGEVGDRVTIEGSGFTRNSVVYFGRIEAESRYVDSDELEFMVPRDAECEVYEVYVQDGRNQSSSMDFKVTDPCGPSNTAPPGEDPPPGDEPPNDDPPPPPPAAGGDDLEDYDTDGNCALSDTEFFVVTDAWISESISDLLFFSAVDAWIGQTNICTASASTLTINLSQTSRGLLISTTTGAALGAVVVYDSNGREVFKQTAQSNRLFWNLRDMNNQQVANGVYYMRTGNSGEMRQFVVMR